MKKFLKALLIFFLVIILIAALFILYLTVREYRPGETDEMEVRSSGVLSSPKQGDELTVMSWNIGFGALGKAQDFVMDGGGNVPSADSDTVRGYLSGIKSVFDSESPDIRFIQEVDIDSSRSFRTDERDLFKLGNDSFALNYSCDFVPFPWPPFGRIQSGVYTTSDYEIASAQRISLPCPFSWPLKVANLKRCLLVTRIPVEGTGKELVAVNFHLEAYADGEKKEAQTRELLEFIGTEYEKGNWVIAGGDWNQYTEASLDLYPNRHEDLWQVGLIDEAFFPEGFKLAMDYSVPSCRLLNQPYDPSDTENTQLYVIDGFVISPNVELKSVQNLDLGFENSDHNPVIISVVLN